MILVRGGDSDDGKGEVTPPATEPEI